MKMRDEDRRRIKKLAEKPVLAVVSFPCLLVVFITALLFYKSLPVLSVAPLDEIFLSTSWRPGSGEFGLLTLIVGSLAVTFLAMLISVPLSLMSSLYLAEYAHRRVRDAVKPLIDLLAGIPSVVFGLWGVLVIVPLVKDAALFFGMESAGYSVLAGGIVLAIMVVPILVSLSDEVLKAIPLGLRETSLAVGATRWETIKYAVLKSAAPGLFAAVILGFGRAFGETMAVLMVVGNVAKIPSSVFDQAYPLPALIANQYGEVMSNVMSESALMLAALVLLLVVLVFNVGASVILVKMREGGYYGQ